MKRDYPNLCKPLKIGPYTLRNRMCSAPMGATDFDGNGTPGPRTQGFYEARAKGGAAIVTVSELVVHPETDGSQMLHLSLKVPGQLAAFTYVADAIRRHGALASIELSHSGQYAGTYMVDKEGKARLHQYGPSDGVRPDGMEVRALTKEQIKDIVNAYADAAELAMRAGFQMCMVHAGHGWLLNQFLSPYFNKRTDEYGGSLENRVRFTREVIEAIRERNGRNFPIELRMSGSELFEGGYDVEEGIRIAQALEDLVDIIHVSAGSYQFGFADTHPSQFKDHGVNVHLAAAIKPHVSVPVTTIGALSDASQMEEIIASGKADMVAMGRGLLADPELPNKVMANKGDDIVKCIRCFVCMAERPITQTRRCAVNPRIGREIEDLSIVPAAIRRKVLVVGGGIAGLMAAYTAKLRGHDVTLAEAKGEIGGILLTEKALDFKYDLFNLVKTYEHLCREAGVEIMLNTKVDAGFVESFAPEALIVAVGSDAMTLSIPIDEQASVFSIDNLYLEDEDPGKEVIVVGGGLTGAECALWLARKGKKVHLVEMRDELVMDANIRQRPILLKEIEAEPGIDVHTSTAAVEVQEHGLKVKTSEGEDFIPGDGIVVAIGQRSRVEDVDALRDGAPYVRIIGDAVRPSNITAATYEGFHAALDI